MFACIPGCERTDRGAAAGEPTPAQHDHPADADEPRPHGDREPATRDPGRLPGQDEGRRGGLGTRDYSKLRL